MLSLFRRIKVSHEETRLSACSACDPDCRRVRGFVSRSGKLLGKGGFGTVRVVTHRATKKKFALKVMTRWLRHLRFVACLLT